MATTSFAEFLKTAGAKPKDVQVAAPTEPTVPAEQSLFSKIGTRTKELLTKGQAIEETNQSTPSKVIQKAGNVANYLTDVAFEGLRAIPGAETLGNAAIKVMKVGSQLVPKAIADKGADAIIAYQQWADENPEASANVEAAFDVASIVPLPKVVSVASKAIKDAAKTSRVAEPLTEAATVAREKLGDAVDSTKITLFGRPQAAGSVEDVIKQADEAFKADDASAAGKLRTVTEKASAKPNLVERWVGISPDIKNRITGKQDKLKEYFDVAHARNNFDTVPTPLEYGAKKVDNAVEAVEGILNDVGSDIGKFRAKVGTYNASIDQVRTIEKTFTDNLEKLNLTVKNGEIVKKPGTVSRVGSDNDISVLNDLYQELQTIKQGPNLQNLIDLRTLFDNKINFSKSAREASTSLDPFSRNLRKSIADVGAEIVGKSEAQNLTKYSDIIDAYNELRSYTDRKAGAEFLLKQVLSERGRMPREIIDSVKEITGIDLMDDAVMASLATDLIGNVRQKGLFRQELTKAGLDVESALSGDKSGLLNLIGSIIKKGLDPEKQYLKAAK